MKARILDGKTERIQTDAVKDGALNDLTGLATVVLAVQRTSDGFWLDFADMTFKNAAWTTRQQAMTQVSAVFAPGEYYYDLNTALVTNQQINDTYMVRIDETGGAAKNMPMVGELAIGQWIAQSHGINQR